MDNKESFLLPGMTLEIKPSKNTDLLVDERFTQKIDNEEFIAKMQNKIEELKK
jgi:hypothetical protein